MEQSLEITECSQRRPYVFISYASDNWKTVFKEAVVPLQNQYGLRVYADKAFDKVNDKWIVPMLRNVRGADMMVAFVSQSYIESYACFLELLTAVNNKKQIVFVSLGENLHLGDTTDQPNVERGVKGEIMNQGGNIATNTNNTSNDIMRAMKSAYTSLSTLLEQDALSKYDISDAFINFFRDASVNQKTVNDLGAVMGTIASISQNVFASPSNPKQSPAPAPPKQVLEYTPSITPEPEPQGQSPSEPLSQAVSEIGPAPWPASETDPPSNFEAAQEPRKRQSPKAKPFLIVGAVGLLALIAAIALVITGRTKNVEDMPYTTSGNNVGTYTGQLKGGKANGQGTFVAANGDVYVGEWRDGYSTGQGTCTYVNGNVYEGGWKKDMFDGEGTFTWANSVIFTGTWSNGNYYGPGTLSYPNGDIFKGEFAGNGLVSKGTCNYANGDVYEGEWSDNGPEGQGTMTCANGDICEGSWKNGLFNGQGTYSSADGSVFMGEWSDGYLTGQGTAVYADGSTYDGEWKNGLRHGQGEYKTTTGDIYTGDWVDNMQEGQCTYRFTDGRIYKGEWSGDAANGSGTLTQADGTLLTGMWKNGEFLG